MKHICFYDILKQRKTEGPLYAPSLLPKGKVLHTTYSIMMMQCVGNTALVDSSGRTISRHVQSNTAATLSLMGAKYHPKRWKVLPNWYAATAPWLQAERIPTGSRNKAKLKLVRQSVIRAKWYKGTYNPAENKPTEEPFGRGRLFHLWSEIFVKHMTFQGPLENEMMDLKGLIL